MLPLTWESLFAAWRIIVSGSRIIPQRSMNICPARWCLPFTVKAIRPAQATHESEFDLRENGLKSPVGVVGVERPWIGALRADSLNVALQHGTR